MSHEVHFTSQQQAERWLREHPDEHPKNDGRLHRNAPKTSKFTNAGAVHASGNDVEVDVVALQTALNNLGDRADKFTTTVANSDSLTQALPNGTGPVADMMGDLFHHRMGDQGGMQYVLTSHLSRLSKMVDNLRTTVANYSDAEDTSVQTINSAPAGEPTA